MQVVDAKIMMVVVSNMGFKIGYFKRQKLLKQIFSDASIKAEHFGDVYYAQWSKWKKGIYDPAIKELKKQYNEEFLALLEESERRMMEMQEDGSWKKSNEEAIRFKHEKDLIDKKVTFQFNALKDNSDFQLYRIKNKYENYQLPINEVKKALSELGFTNKKIDDLIWESEIGDSHNKNGSKPTNERYIIGETIEKIIDSMKYAIINRGLE